jgi:CO/xanthine dehydrogenase FAD-binding subunit
MKDLQYVRATGIGEALALLNEEGSRNRVLAGNTDLCLLLRADPDLCDRVVDISLIPELHRITASDGQVMIGAAATFQEVLTNPIVLATAPVLAQACSQVGAVQIRNMGTLGGNVANAAACADSLPALVCLDARANVRYLQGEQTWPVAELVLQPNHTRMPRGSLLVSFSYQAPGPGSRSVFLKLGRRNAMAISRLTVAVLGRLGPSGRITEVRIVPGAATPQVRRILPAEELMLGKPPSMELYAAAARRVTDEMIQRTGRRWSTEYKEPALLALTQRALQIVFDEARPQGGDRT